MKTTLRAVVRIEHLTKKPAIFYRIEGSAGHRTPLTCYTRDDMHSDAALGYYRRKTHAPATPLEVKQAAELVAQYAALCEQHGENLSISTRLRDN